MTDAAGTLAGAVRHATRRHAERVGRQHGLGEIKSLQPLIVDLLGTDLVLGGADIKFAADVQRFDQTEHLTVGDGLLLAEIAEGEWVAHTALSDTPVTPVVGPAGFVPVRRDVPMDGTVSSGVPHIDLRLTTAHGDSGTRGEATAAPSLITSDASNTDGTFFEEMFLAITHLTGGSAQILTLVGKVNDSASTPAGYDGYGELGCIEELLICDRAGAYVAGVESLVQALKPARANNLVLFTDSNVPITDFTTTIFGTRSSWPQTGTRGIWLASVGTENGGTAIFVQNDYEHGLMFMASDASKPIVEFQQYQVPSAMFSLLGNGTLRWGIGGVGGPDVTLARTAADLLTLTGGLTVTAGLTVDGALNVIANSVFGGDLLITGALNVDTAIGATGDISSVGGRVTAQVSLETAGYVLCAGDLEHTGTHAAFFGHALATQPVVGAASAGGTYTAAEQGMLQRVYDCVRNLGLGT